MLVYHALASIFWRLVLLLLWPLTVFGWFEESALWVAWRVLYHDDRTAR